MECVLNAVLNLLREPLLHLQAVAENVYHTGYLAQAGDVAIGNIGHMGLAVERQHVVLAKREEVDILHDHHLVVALLEKGVGEHFVGILRVAARQYLHGLGHTHGGLLKTLPLGVFAQQIQYVIIISRKGVETLAEFCLWIHLV